MIKGPKKAVSVLMPMDLYERMKALSEETSWSLSAYIRQVLKSYLWHLENCPERLEGWRTVKAHPKDGLPDTLRGGEP